MKDHPLFKALLAEGYIVAFALAITYVAPQIQVNAGPLLAIPTVLSLFVFSAATMGYLFLYTPLLLALEGKTKEATLYFIHTVLYFALVAGITVTLIALALHI